MKTNPLMDYNTELKSLAINHYAKRGYEAIPSVSSLNNLMRLKLEYLDQCELLCEGPLDIISLLKYLINEQITSFEMGEKIKSRLIDYLYTLIEGDFQIENENILEMYEDEEKANISDHKRKATKESIGLCKGKLK